MCNACATFSTLIIKLSNRVNILDSDTRHDQKTRHQAVALWWTRVLITSRVNVGVLTKTEKSSGSVKLELPVKIHVYAQVLRSHLPCNICTEVKLSCLERFKLTRNCRHTVIYGAFRLHSMAAPLICCLWFSIFSSTTFLAFSMKSTLTFASTATFFC